MVSMQEILQQDQLQHATWRQARRCQGQTLAALWPRAWLWRWRRLHLEARVIIPVGMDDPLVPAIFSDLTVLTGVGLSVGLSPLDPSEPRASVLPVASRFFDDKSP